jgi:serine phosphatase RsbU (regulator of sigma subunit)
MEVSVNETSLNAELEKLKRENAMLALNLEELTRTNEFLVTATWREREMKQRLHEALEELRETKKLVDAQHKNITDSINYASRIQHAIIPTEADVKQFFVDAFVYYEPKDTVSGDFPWIFHTDHYTYLAAVDCTGHGVPGAMMSLIGNLLLNGLAKQENIDPASLLDQLHQNVVRTLKQHEGGTQTSDGMDIALCRINHGTGEVQFSGAHRPLYHATGGEIRIYPGDKFPIGGNQYRGRSQFSNFSIKPAQGECIYFFSDGLTDQFGGPDGLKFGPRRTREILLDHTHRSMNEQHTQIRQALQDWKKITKQTDDILLIGIKF